jgi:NADH:ubiquinone oxidoreductase subunit 6 (subunit J)
MTTLTVIGGGIALVTLAAALLVVTSRVPIHAACFLILTLLGVAAEYALLEAHALAVLQVLVYAGAIVVLLVFVLMLMGSGPKDQEPFGLGEQRAIMLAALTIALVGLAFAGIRGWLGVPAAAVAELLVLAGTIPAMLLVPGPEAEGRKGDFRVAAGAVLAVGLLVFFGQGLAREGIGAADGAPSSQYGELSQLGELLLGPYLFSFEIVSLLLMVAIVGSVALLRRRAAAASEEEAER